MKTTFILFLLAILLADLHAETYHYFYLSDQRVVTVELLDAQKAILNYINLSDGFEIIQAPMLVLLDGAGKPSYGHVIEVDNPSEASERFKVSDLLKPREYKGYNILGKYNFEPAPAKAYFKVGSRILEMEPLSKEDFELVAARIGEIDLAGQSPERVVREAGFNRGYGVLHRAGGEGSEELEKLFRDLELVPPILLANPQPGLPKSALNLPDPVVVKLSALVTRSGGVHKLEVRQGINPTVDEIAIEAVRNSWKFLPAISKGEVADATLTLNVVFQRK